MSVEIRAQNACIEFPIGRSEPAAGDIPLVQGSKKTSHMALRDLTFAWNSGDRVGIRGANGAGKTTLLKLLAGVYAPTAGSLQIRGKVVSLTDIFMGFDSGANALQNIQLRGRLLGASPAHIQAVSADICAFSELGEFLYLPLRTYSSGMLMRLAFSVSAFMPCDILLMDEWLSVGDAAFNIKAEEKLKLMVDSAKIFVLASHATSLLDRLCNVQYEVTHGTLVAIQKQPLDKITT